jgi:hypothetical protein
MPAMIRRRAFALIAAFAVAFGALWPLVSAAKPRAPQIPVFMCSQSGFAHPDAPGDAGDDFHCPLCIASADGLVPAIVAIPAAKPIDAIAVERAREPAPHPSFNSHPPPSRAPPALS